MDEREPAVIDPGMEERLKEEAELTKKHKWAATAFFWIAGLSLLNTILIMAGFEWGFSCGLGITLLIDVMSLVIFEETGGTSVIFSTVALVVNLGIAWLFVKFGMWTSQRRQKALLVGIVLYSLDTILFLVATDFIGAGFHALILCTLISGHMAGKKLDELQKRKPSMPGVPRQMVRT